MSRTCRKTAGLFGLFAVAVALGCQNVPSQKQAPEAPAAVATNVPPPGPVPTTPPRELCKVVLPTYVIEPPDILVIEGVHIVPRSPYHLRTLDSLAIQVQGTLPDEPISGVYPIQIGGLVDLGFSYGAVPVAGMTVEDAGKAIEEKLKQRLREPVINVSLAGIAAQQQISGDHLVGPDGTVTLGSYGSVQVVGMTIAQAKWAVEQHLAQFLENPEISLDVWAYNSKVYYIVTQGAGLGDGVYRFPITGSETVLDAIAQINGLQHVSSKRIWIARPAPEPGRVQVLPVSWEAITAEAGTVTNYQILPGDRVFVAEDKLIALDNSLAKLIAPFERVMGFSIFGAGTVTRFSGTVLKGGGNAQNTF